MKYRIFILVLTGLLLSSAVFTAENQTNTKAIPQADLVFSPLTPGKIYNRLAPDHNPAYIRTRTPYQRMKVDAILTKPDYNYPHYVSDRRGRPYALRFGDASESLHRLPFDWNAEQPFTLSLWLYIPDKSYDLHGRILDSHFGYKHGFRLEYTRTFWCKNGHINFVWGIDSGSDSLSRMDFPVNTWHNLILTSDNENISMYVNSKLVGTKPGRLTYKPGQNPVPIISGAVRKPWDRSLDFVIDEFVFYDSALTAQAVQTIYDNGNISQDYTLEINQSPTIPHDSYGYFVTDEIIPIHTSATNAILLINGIETPLKDAKVSYSQPGLYNLQLELKLGDKIIAATCYPLAITPELPKSSPLGVNGLANLQPEAAALGINFSRIVLDWRVIEPQKQEYDWLNSDRIIEKSVTDKSRILIAVQGIPTWAKTNQLNHHAYQRFWRYVVRRYDTVALFEIVPEDKLTSEQGFIFYLDCLTLASQVIRQECPDAKIVAGGLPLSLDTSQLRQLSDQLTQADFDILSVTGSWKIGLAEISDFVKTCKYPVWNVFAGQRQFYQIDTEPQRHSAETLFNELVLQTKAGVSALILAYAPSIYGYGFSDPHNGAPGYQGIALAAFGIYSQNNVDLSVKQLSQLLQQYGIK